MKKTFFIIVAALLLTPLRAEWWDKQFNWSGASSVAPGIVQAQWKVKSPRIIRIYALRIDTRTHGLRFHFTPKDPDYGKPMPDAPDFIIRTRRETTRKFVERLVKRRFPVAAAFNAAPWSPWRAPFTHKYADRMGLLISDGDVIMPPDGKRPSLVVTKDGKVDLAVIPANADVSILRHAVSGFSFVLLDGKIVPVDHKALAPRTGFGLSKDKRYLYVFVADGRQKNSSMGLTHREVGNVLRFLGAHSGLNMDGGGSSTLLVRRSGKTVMLNHQPGGGERPVGASIAVSVPR